MQGGGGWQTDTHTLRLINSTSLVKWLFLSDRHKKPSARAKRRPAKLAVPSSYTKLHQSLVCFTGHYFQAVEAAGICWVTGGGWIAPVKLQPYQVNISYCPDMQKDGTLVTLYPKNSNLPTVVPKRICSFCKSEFLPVIFSWPLALYLGFCQLISFCLRQSLSVSVRLLR